MEHTTYAHNHHLRLNNCGTMNIPNTDLCEGDLATSLVELAIAAQGVGNSVEVGVEMVVAPVE